MTDNEPRNRSRRFVFAGGGSGGHLTPSLAVAAALLRLDPQAGLLFLTSGRDIDQRVLAHSELTADARCQVVALPVTQPPRLTWSGPQHMWALGRAFLQCLREMKRDPVDALLATGAFASVPGLLAAQRLGVPTVLFEANVVPGRVNRWWSPRAALKFSAWPVESGETEASFEPVGMPVREQSQMEVAGHSGASRQILVVGGSQGSRRLNQLVNEMMSEFRLPQGWTMLHQTGDSETAADTAESNGVTSVPFVDDIDREMQRSDIVISRAGAVTLGELAAAGCPAVLLPMERAADNHQQRNARRLERNGAAVVVKESSLQAADELSVVVRQLIDDVSRRETMATAMRTLHQPDAAERIARGMLNLAGSR